jgi:hypothetical protein
LALAPVAKAVPKVVPHPAAASTTWQNLGQKTGEPVTGYDANGLLEVFTLDSGTLWHRPQKTNGTFGGWASLGNPPLPDGQIAVANEADGRLVVVFRASDGTIAAIRQKTPNGSWGTWSAPLATGTDGHLELFAVVESKESAQLAQALTELRYTRQVSPGGAWAPWVNAGYVGKAGQEDFRWFLQRASPGGAWNFNPVLPAPKAITSLAGATSLDVPASMVDLNTDTAFTGRPAQVGDHVGADLGVRRQLRTVEFVPGQDGAVQQGVVEYSGDGTGWTPLATVSGSPDVTVALPSGVAVRYVRLRATAGQARPVSVHEVKTA